jgi:hypothetical protein
MKTLVRMFTVVFILSAFASSQSGDDLTNQQCVANQQFVLMSRPLTKELALMAKSISTAASLSCGDCLANGYLNCQLKCNASGGCTDDQLTSCQQSAEGICIIRGSCPSPFAQ